MCGFSFYPRVFLLISPALSSLVSAVFLFILTHAFDRLSRNNMRPLHSQNFCFKRVITLLASHYLASVGVTPCASTSISAHLCSMEHAELSSSVIFPPHLSHWVQLPAISPIITTQPNITELLPSSLASLSLHPCTLFHLLPITPLFSLAFTLGH